MSDDLLPPLSSDALNLLREETSSAAPAFTDATRARLMARLQLSAKLLAPSALASPAADTGALGTAATSGGWTKLVSVLVSGLVGSGVGAAGHALYVQRHPPQPQPQIRVSASGTPALTLQPPTTPDVLPPHEPAAAPVLLPRRTGPAPKSTKDSDERLLEEQALLSMARASLSRNQVAVAVSALEEHVARFPQGALVEERKALFIHALRLQGRETQAENELQDFAREFPESLFLPTLGSGRARTNAVGAEQENEMR